LLDPLTGYVPGNGGAVGLASDFIDFVDVDDSKFSPFDIIISVLKQAEDDGFDILADVAGFRQGGGIGDGEGHIQNAGEGAGEKSFPGSRRTDQENVAFLQFHIGMVGRKSVGLRLPDAFVVVVHRNGEGAFGPILAHSPALFIFAKAQFHGARKPH